MSIQFKRGTATANDSYTGLDGEITIDTTQKLIRVHDGSTVGGAFYLGATDSSGSGSATNLDITTASSSVTVISSTGTNVTIPGATPSNAGVLTAADKTKLDSIGEGEGENREIASVAQAENGVDNTTTITPLRLFEALAAGNFNIDFGDL